jgi:O-antigen/teichoic acid export membrane protein
MRKSLLMSFAEKYTLLLIGMASSMLLARLLTPAQIGVFSVGAVVVGIAQLIRDFGVGQYLVQEAELNAEKIRAAFTLTLLIAWAVAGLLALISEPVAAFYGVKGARDVLRVLALNCLLIPFGSITMPCLRRDMCFGALYCINVASGLANFIAGVGLALCGFGFMSLAWAAVAGTAATVLASLVFRPAGLPWRPGFRGMRRLLSFGAYATGSNILDETGVAAPDLIIGKLLGMEAVGLFSKAQGVLGIFNQLIVRAVTPVILPLYASQARDGGDMKQAYLNTISYMAVFSWPFFAVLAILAGPCVRLLYGPQWDAAVEPVRILCLSAAVFSLFVMARDLLVAMGHVRRRARLEMLSVPLRVVGIVIAAPFGLAAVAWSIVLTTVVKSALIYAALAEVTGMRWRDLGHSVAKGAAIAALASIAPLSAMQALYGNGGGLSGALALPLAVALPGAAVGWIAGIFLFKHDIRNDIAAALRRIARFAGPREKHPVKTATASPGDGEPL